MQSSKNNTVGRWCSIVHVMALSSVLGKDIAVSIFPKVGLPYVNHDDVIGMEINHLSALARRIIRAYVAVRIKSYHAKRYSKMIAHGNIPSSRHEMTKLIILYCLKAYELVSQTV